jgi:tRNA U34 5-carboxymethylaminomethyl modifying GTPase MnmE/TrmE
LTESDVVLVLITPENKDFLAENSELLQSEKVIIIGSKCDLYQKHASFDKLSKNILYVSAETGEGVDLLKKKIVDIALKK